MFMADGGEGPAVRLEDHQPGPVRLRDQAALDVKERAYRQRAHDDENAWKNPPLRVEPIPDPRGSSNSGNFRFASGKEGDLCTCRGPDDRGDEGAAGILQMVDGRLICVAGIRKDGRDAAPSILNDARFVENDRQETARAYATYDHEQENAWRNKG
jgi:hypothetical protein